MSFLVHGIGHGRGRSAPDRGAARSVGHHHAVAEQLGHQFYIRRFAAAGAGARELQQRLFELGTFHRILLHGIRFFRHFIHRIIPGRRFVKLGIQRFHEQRLAGRRADLGAVAAALAVVRGNYHGKLAAVFYSHGRFGRIADLFRFRVVQQYRTDGSVRAHKGALVALDTFFHIPFRHVDGDAAFFVSGSANREGAVGVTGHDADRQLVAFLPVNRNQNIVDERIAGLFGFHFVFGIRPGSGNINFYNGFDAFVDGRIVHVNHVLAFHAIGCFHGVLQIFHRVGQRNDIRQFEERGLHDHVDAAAQTDGLRNLHRVNDIEINMLLRNVLFHGSRQFLVQFFRRPAAVQQEVAALFQAGHNIIFVNIGLIMNSHIVSVFNQVRFHDGLFAEPQMGYGNAAGFLGIVSEITLRIHVGVVADDLDGALVGANGTVGTQAPELAALGSLRGGVQDLAAGQGGVVHVVVNANGKAVLRRSLAQVFNDRIHFGGREFFGTQTETAAYDNRFHVALIERAADILIQRFAQAARFLGAVQHRNLFHSLRNRSQEMFHRERTVQVNCQHADLCAFCRIDQFRGLDGGLLAGAHNHDQLVRVLRTVVIEQMVFTAGDLADFGHVFFHDFRNRFIVFVNGFAALEVSIRVLGRAAHNRSIRIQATLPERFYSFPVQHVRIIFVIEYFNLLNFMGRTETVKEVQERNAALNGGHVGYAGQVHNFLHAAFRQHGETGLTAGHHILMIAEDTQVAGSQRTGRNVEHTRQQFAGNFIHVRNHQQQTLGGSVGSRQGACLQRAVYRACSAGFRLHLQQFYRLSEQILFPCGSPFIHVFRHRRRRRDGINAGCVNKSIGCVSGGLVAVHCFHNCHKSIPLFIKLNNTLPLICSAICT